ncbi:unnamed protein product [Arabis nemorensis]|uniref:Bifunctional inhibitor/plant lipid transfer protein/seed storage helical domain-containing protein n=1 Tax=Arabis nemorensis TaxID=586526 RepID=A0A565CDD6_9BRAS|nr:unnamed protein product [Arabis nemorensis]
MDCLSFLLVGSTDSSPTKSCCVGIKSVVDYNPQCLCYGIESSEAMGFALDNTKAFAMPSICSVSVDPHCEVASSAASTPVASPAAAPPSTSPSSKKSPATTPSLPTVNPSSPTVTKPPVATASSPAATLSPAVTASSPAPSPSKSSSGNLSASKLFLAAIIVSSFAHVLA